MADKERNQELKEIIDNLGISPEQAQQMLDDIQQGDALLDKYAQPFMPQQVTDNINCVMRQALAKQQSQRKIKAVYQRIAAAVIIVILSVVAILQWQNHTANLTTHNIHKTIASNIDNNQSTQITLDEADILELALIAEQQQNESDIDDMLLTEVLSLWDSSHPQNNSSRKESSYETENNYFSGISSRYAYA